MLKIMLFCETVAVDSSFNLRWDAGRRPEEGREIRTGILLPAVSPISQRRPDYIKSFNPGLRPKPAVQVLSRGLERERRE